jgi:hypothetical protein
VEYRGIQLGESLKLYKKNGEYHPQIKRSLDKLIEMLSKNNHVLKSEVKGNQEKILIDYNCGHEPHWTNAGNYKDGRGNCPKCKIGMLSEKNFEQAKKNFLLMFQNNKHELLSEYKGRQEKTLINFKCGHEPHWVTPNNYVSGRGNCPKCKIEMLAKRNIQKAKEFFSLLVKSNGHILLSEYKYNDDKNRKVLIDYNCGHEPHWITPYAYKTGQGCPICKQSKGVKNICEWLEKNKIEYELEYIFPFKKKWRYDIYIPRYDLLVEVQGIQHYKEIDFFKNRTLKQEQENDRKKQEFIELICYDFIEVDYREGKPVLALERFLKAFNEIRRKNGLKELA